MKFWLGVWVLWMCLAPASHGQTSLAEDVQRLTHGGHRLTGTGEHRAAVDYLERRLRDIGVEQVYPLEFPVVQVVNPLRLTTLEVDGVALGLSAMRPNVVVPPTLDHAIEAPLVYLGGGELEDYRDRSVDGAVVVMDYDSGANWERAFARGAAAVVFWGSGEEMPVASKYAPVPLNLPRFYVGGAAHEQAAVDLSVDRARVRLSQRRQQAGGAGGTGRNLAALIPGAGTGTEPSGEVLVVAVATDTFGPVPLWSPGARRAANAAGLLALAETLHKNPPRRDVLLVFFDGRSQRHRGARHFYDALMMSDADSARLVEDHAAEQSVVREALRNLDSLAASLAGEADGEAEIPPGLRNSMRERADWMRADLDRRRQNLRRSGGIEQDAAPDTLAAELAALAEEVAAWDRVRRELHLGSTAGELIVADEPSVGRLIERTRSDLTRRLNELSALATQDAQRAALREAITAIDNIKRVVLHVDLDLSDGGTRWAPVAGGGTHRFHGVRPPDPGADAPGYHARLLSVFDDLAERGVGGLYAHLEREALRDPAFADSFVPGLYAHSGSVAGDHGLYHLAFMTGHDARPRDGHPGDTPRNLDFSNFEGQLAEAIALLRAAADEPAITQRASFSSFAMSKHPGWDDGRSTGSSATLRVTGGLSENRPAVGAAVALWPGSKWDADVAWKALDQPHPADYGPLDLAPVDANGRFAIVGLRRDVESELTTFGFRLDGAGRVDAVTTKNTLNDEIVKALRTDLIAARGYGLTWRGPTPGDTRKYKLLRASSDAGYRDNLSLVGRGGAQLFWFLADRAAESRVKLFDPEGPAALGIDEANRVAQGISTGAFARPRSWVAQSAGDLWRLNEGRLARLRARGVTAPDLELLHAAAGRLLEEDREASKLQSVTLSQRVYPRLQRTMEDLVYAIVVLLLLTIPFAFALERLLVGASGVYGRIAGFTAAFMATFGVLYATHPGFAISSTPVMIFLAFAISLLSVMVIWLLLRRFQAELTAMQQGSDGNAAHPSGGGGAAVGTAMAAIGMGISTMRRRPTRTLLTTVTVVMLTFTILCFASVRREVGVRSVGLGPVTDAMPGRAVLVRRVDGSALPSGTLELLTPVGGWAEGWWKTPDANDDRPVTVARADDGRVVRLGAVLGLDKRAFAAWPELRGVLAGGEDLPGDINLPVDAVYLSASTAAALDLAVGDAVRVNGYPLTFAGSTDNQTLTKLRQVDGEPWLPVDVSAESALRGAAGAGGAVESADADVVGQTIRLGANQVAVASNDTVRQLGGDLRSLTRFVDAEENPDDVAERLARQLSTPVWVTGPEGSRRLTLGRTTQVSGVLQLVAPIVLGGLIIFGTLLGSISDRQKEIYTFSALGLGPKHVGLLFFAEAAVYAVVGGLGGQLLAQVVALGASWAAAWGWVRPVSINFASTQALFAIAVVMTTVLVSAIYPAVRASRSANPGLARAWVMPPPEPAPRDDELNMIFPFTVSAYDLTGVVAYLAEHFRQHADAGLGPFAASEVTVGKDDAGRVQLAAELALAPFDLGVTQRLTLTGRPSDISGVDEVAVGLHRLSGTKGDWVRANRVFIKRLRRQFLVWRTLPTAAVESYRMQTLETLGEREPGGAKPQAAGGLAHA